MSRTSDFDSDRYSPATATAGGVDTIGATDADVANAVARVDRIETSNDYTLRYGEQTRACAGCDREFFDEADADRDFCPDCTVDVRATSAAEVTLR